MAPACGRLPLTWEIVARLATMVLCDRSRDLAVIIVLSMAFSLRPAECKRLRVRDLAVAGLSHRFWALTLHMYEGEVSKVNKTGEFDAARHPSIPFLGGRPGRDDVWSEQAMLFLGPPGELGRFTTRANAELCLANGEPPPATNHPDPDSSQIDYFEIEVKGDSDPSLPFTGARTRSCHKPSPPAA